MKSSDIAAVWEPPSNYNAGFIVVKPTLFSFRVYKMTRDITSKSKVTVDQWALNAAIRSLTTQKNGVNATFLDKHVFMNGNGYFERMRRLLPRADDTCSLVNKINCSVLVVHNNWIYSSEAKIYRFREHLLWWYDGDNQYYSNKTRKYLTYINLAPTGSRISLSVSEKKQRQLLALRTALSIGHLLNRAVILPRFYCSTKAFQCPLNSLVHIKTFDAVFANQYRESSFLQHPRIPDNVKHNVSYHQLVLHTTRTSSAHEVVTISTNDIVKLFQYSQDKVINFGILDKIEVKFQNDFSDTAFNKKIRKAFKLSDYRQKKVSEYRLPEFS